jgi:hypothetical protein
MPLQFEDLMITQVSEADQREFQTLFASLMPGGKPGRPIAFNRVGECFVEGADHAVHVVSCLAGDSFQIAPSVDAFMAQVNTPAWQEEFLWSQKVFGWKSAGIKVGPTQVYALVPHPMANEGQISDKVQPTELKAWLKESAKQLGLAKA